MRAEAGRIAHAVEVLRGAPAAARRPLLLSLQREPCTDGAACETRAICTEAYELEARALEEIGVVRRAANREDAPIPEGTAELLEKAQALLESSHEQAARCADLEAKLRKVHRL